MSSFLIENNNENNNNNNNNNNDNQNNNDNSEIDDELIVEESVNFLSLSTDVIKLSAKLQSLIDNYCDHRNTQQTCQDCGKYV